MNVQSSGNHSPWVSTLFFDLLCQEFADDVLQSAQLRSCLKISGGKIRVILFYLLWEADSETMLKMTVTFTWELSSKVLISSLYQTQPLTHPRGGFSKVLVGIWIFLQIPARKDFLPTVCFISLFSVTSPLNCFLLSLSLSASLLFLSVAF